MRCGEQLARQPGIVKDRVSSRVASTTDMAVLSATADLAFLVVSDLRPRARTDTH